MQRLSSYAAALAAVMLAAATSQAQGRPTDPEWLKPTVEEPERDSAATAYGLPYANRRLIMPNGMIRGTIDFVIGDRDDTTATFSTGAALAVGPRVEFGLSRYRMGSAFDMNIIPTLGFGGEGGVAFLLAPDFDFGDVPLYTRVLLADTPVFQLAMDLVLRIPARTEVGFLGGVPMRIIIAERFAIDTGAQFSIDKNPAGSPAWSVNIPLNLVGNVTEQGFVKLTSGLHIFDITDVIGTLVAGRLVGPFYFVPLGAGGGYTFEAGRTMIDLFAHFNFPAFFGANNGESGTNTDIWAITIGINIYSPVLFGPLGLFD